MDARPLPSALAHEAEIAARLGPGPRAILLDYDGTLTPIAARPELATLSPEARTLLTRLESVSTVGIITGRDMATIQRLIGVDGLAVASDHGFVLQLPDGHEETAPGAEPYRALIDDVAATARTMLGSIDGAIVEAKPFSVAIHYRLAAPEHVAEIEAAVAAITDRFPQFHCRPGKKVFELRPDLDWDKGSALFAIIDALGVAPDRTLFIGDDLTDEDAFRALGDRGTTILVADRPRASAARYRLHDTNEVTTLLAGLCERLSQPPDGA
jgi:trehalose 6-phosphate phosphatase